MSRPVIILPEIPIDNWYDRSAPQTAEEQIIKAILNGIEAGDQQSFLNSSLRDIPNPALLKNIESAVDLVIHSILNNKKILIVGDYDVDGITATALLLRFFRKLAYKNIDSFIPNRFLHGYGLTEKTVEIIQTRNPSLVITVDNGITAKKEIEQIRELGIEVIVTDHHLPQQESLPECAVLNPKQEDCNYPYKHLSGVGVVFILLIAIRTRLRELGFWLKNGSEPNLLEHLDLVALGTIADQVPLLGLNRVFAKYGLQQMTQKIHDGYPGELFQYLKVFAQQTRIKSYNSESIAFSLAPLLNATGRLKDAEDGLNFLLSDDDHVALSRYQYLDRLNQKRKKKQQIMSKKALQQAEKLLGEAKGMVVYDASFHEGLIGIIASHLVERFCFPAVVMTDGEPGVLKASCRSKNENIMEILKECEGLLIQYGGHANAAGFSLEKESLSQFHERFTGVCNDLFPQGEQTQVNATIEVTLEMMTFKLIERLRVLEPYGHKNRKPVFFVPRVRLPLPTTMTGKHLKWKLGTDLELIYWNGVEAIAHSDSYDIAFTLGENTFRGERKRQLIVNSIVANHSS